MRNAIVALLSLCWAYALTASVSSDKGNGDKLAPTAGLTRNSLQQTGTVKSDGRTLAIEAGTPIVLRLSETLGKTSSQDRTASLVATNDIIIDGLVVVAKGSEAVFGIARRENREHGRAGELEVRVEGIYARTGHLVPLTWQHHVTGEPIYCRAIDCVILVFPFVKGGRASIPEGTLFAARVSQVTWFDRGLIERIGASASTDGSKPPLTSDGRLHFYYPEREGPSPKWTSIRIDGKKVGTIGAGAYACLSLPPGPHTLEADKDSIQFEVAQGGEYYVRLPQVSSFNSEAGYQFIGKPLAPAGKKALRGQTPCF